MKKLLNKFYNSLSLPVFKQKMKYKTNSLTPKTNTFIVIGQKNQPNLKMNFYLKNNKILIFLNKYLKILSILNHTLQFMKISHFILKITHTINLESYQILWSSTTEIKQDLLLYINCLKQVLQDTMKEKVLKIITIILIYLTITVKRFQILRVNKIKWKNSKISDKYR